MQMKGLDMKILAVMGALFPDVDLQALDYDGDMEPKVIAAAKAAACRALGLRR